MNCDNNTSTETVIDINNIRVDITDVENNKFEDYKVEEMIDIFTELVKKAATLPSTKYLCVLDDLALSYDLPSLALLIEREPMNEDTRLFYVDDENAVDYDYYVGTFTTEWGDKTLKLQASLYDEVARKITYYDKPLLLEMTLGLPEDWH